MAINFDDPPLYDDFTDKGEKMSSIFQSWLATFYQTINQKLLNWQVVTISQTMQITNGYFCNGNGVVLLLLPQTSDVGDIVEVAAMNASGFSITQGALQQIQYNGSTTTMGAGGSLSSAGIGMTARLACTVANKNWIVLSGEGTLTVV